MKNFLTSLLVAAMFLLPTVGNGTMTIRKYSAARHYRFYTGSDKNFIGTLYDFSGVGYSSGGEWATLVSDSYFISATHLHPTTGQTVTFYTTNSLTGTKYTYTVAGGMQIGKTDLWVGWFSTTVNPSIERYPILTLPELDDYNNLILYNYGKQDLVGRNVLDDLYSYTSGSTGMVAWYDYDGKDTPSVGGDETVLQSGDSGAPSFVVYNSSLALVGIHWLSDRYTISGDTFVPYYYNNVNAVLGSSKQALEAVPEPDMSLYAMIISCCVWLRRRHCNKP